MERRSAHATGRLFVNWYYSPSYAQITFTPVTVTGGPVQLSLNERPLMKVTPASIGERLDALVPLEERQLFRSHRFTVRHATNDAEQYAVYQGQRAAARRMGATARQAGFPYGRDIYASMWGGSGRWDDQSPFTAHAYADCSKPMKADGTTYNYRSKTCSVPDRAYVWLSSFDPLVRMLQGLHVLGRHRDPGRRYDDPEHTRVSVRTELPRWEAMYRRQGGIPRCSPISCDSTWSSGIRTAVFGALETEMGYRFDDPVSRSYADRAATMILASQIKAPGLLRMAYGTFYRPLMAGGFMIAWRPGMLIGFSPKISAKAVDETVSALSMPQEYVGYVVSNGESAMAAYAFLVRYRCLKYDVGCTRQIVEAG